MLARLRSAISRNVVYGLAGLCGVVIATLLLGGHFDWEVVGGMAVGMFAVRGLFEVIVDLVAWCRRRGPDGGSR